MRQAQLALVVALTLVTLAAYSGMNSIQNSLGVGMTAEGIVGAITGFIVLTLVGGTSLAGAWLIATK